MNSYVLVVHSSPRQKSNSSFLAETAIAVFKQKNRLFKEVHLSALNIHPCTACEGCSKGSKNYCVIADDMEPLYHDVVNADALLLASPIYWFTYSAQLKTFIDRLYGAWKKNQNFLKDKRVGAILTFGDSDMYESGVVNALHTFEHMFRFTKAHLVGFSYGIADGVNEARNNQSLIENTRKLALKFV